jgi:hypothetical protein
MSAAKKPSHVMMRVYNVGFGDCTLLTFHYPDGDRRHLLVDFGSTKMKGGAITQRLVEIAKDIHGACGGQLHGVVVSHRHQDHLRGFETKSNGKGPGDIIKSCSPKVVIQPWTENPNLKENAYSARELAGGSQPEDTAGRPKLRAYISSLDNMQAFASYLEGESKRRGSSFSAAARRDMGVYGEINLPNLSAIRNLRTMARNKYVRYGDRLRLQSIFPGVTFKVLGPPDLEQCEEIFGHRTSDQDEFWQLAGFWARAALDSGAVAADGGRFPGAEKLIGELGPPPTRWFTRRVRSLHGEQLLSIVRILDTSLNNTSVILYIKFGGTKMLFPGDAQIENWSYALGRPNVKKLLSEIHVYKVGHHGSRNATPKTLWNNFRNRKGPADTRLCTILETLPGVHGQKESKTEVPRSTLVDALRSDSTLIRTDQMGDAAWEDWEIQA